MKAKRRALDEIAALRRTGDEKRQNEAERRQQDLFCNLASHNKS